MVDTIEATRTVDSPVETPIAQPARTPRRRRVALWVSALAAVGGVAALTIAVVGNDTGDGAPSGPVFTEHSRLHVVDEETPVPDGSVFTEHGQLHGADEAAPVRNPSLMRFPVS